MYSEKVMDHFTNPRNVGEIADASGVGTVGNAKCGDIMRIYLKIENGIIEDVKFKTFGCGAAIATSSMATEMVKGKSIEEAMKLIAEKENLEPTDEEYEEAIKGYAEEAGMDDVDAFKEQYGEDTLKESALLEAVLDYLVDNCVQVEASESE